MENGYENLKCEVPQQIFPLQRFATSWRVPTKMPLYSLGLPLRQPLTIQRCTDLPKRDHFCPVIQNTHPDFCPYLGRLIVQAFLSLSQYRFFFTPPFSVLAHYTHSRKGEEGGGRGFREGKGEGKGRVCAPDAAR
jgi:hypothetical protein